MTDDFRALLQLLCRDDFNIVLASCLHSLVFISQLLHIHPPLQRPWTSATRLRVPAQRGPHRHCRRRPARRGRAPLSRPETLCFRFGQNVSAHRLGLMADKHFDFSTVVTAAGPSRRKQAHVPQTLLSFRWCAVTSTLVSQTLIILYSTIIPSRLQTRAFSFITPPALGKL